MLASALLSKATFLCSVLCEDEECHHLAFKIGMFGIELARPPASNKALEVRICNIKDMSYLKQRTRKWSRLFMNLHVLINSYECQIKELPQFSVCRFEKVKLKTFEPFFFYYYEFIKPNQ